MATITVIAVAVCTLAFRPLGQRTGFIAGISAGFLMHCTAGETRRAQLAVMLVSGAAMSVIVALGTILVPYSAGRLLALVAVAFATSHARARLPRRPLFPVFGFVLFLLSGLSGSGATRALWNATAVGGAALVDVILAFVLAPRPLVRAVQAVARALFADVAAALRGEQDPTHDPRSRLTENTRALEEVIARYPGIRPDEPLLDGAIADAAELALAIAALDDPARGAPPARSVERELVARRFDLRAAGHEPPSDGVAITEERRASPEALWLERLEASGRTLAARAQLPSGPIEPAEPVDEDQP